MAINGDLIKELRIKKNLSVREFAKLCGVANSQISDLETGQLQNTTVDTICKIANALECNPADLFTC